MKKILKTIIIGIFTVSIATGCVRFSNDTNDKQEKNISEEMKERSRYALCELSPHENPYINYILTGNYRKDCLPYFLRKENFDKIRKNLHKVEIIQSSVEEYLDNIDYKINKFNLPISSLSHCLMGE